MSFGRSATVPQAGQQRPLVTPYDQRLAEQYEMNRRRELLDLERLKWQMATGGNQGSFDLARRLLGF